jgi:hypothetical protein
MLHLFIYCLRKRLSKFGDTLRLAKAKTSGPAVGFEIDSAVTPGFATALETIDLIVVAVSSPIASIAADHESLGGATDDTAASLRRTIVSTSLGCHQAAVDCYRSWLESNFLVYCDGKSLS